MTEPSAAEVRWRAYVEEGAWSEDRPATPVLGDPRLALPTRRENQFEPDCIRLTVEEALTLQSFPPDYPVQGNKHQRYTQIGNAIPPLLAWHVLREATGL